MRGRFSATSGEEIGRVGEVFGQQSTGGGFRPDPEPPWGTAWRGRGGGSAAGEEIGHLSIAP